MNIIKDNCENGLIGIQQVGGTCWFNSIINTLLLGEYSRVLLIKKLNEYLKTNNITINPDSCPMLNKGGIFQIIYRLLYEKENPWSALPEKLRNIQTKEKFYGIDNTTLDSGGHTINAIKRIFDKIGVSYYISELSDKKVEGAYSSMNMKTGFNGNEKDVDVLVAQFIFDQDEITINLEAPREIITYFSEKNINFRIPKSYTNRYGNYRLNSITVGLRMEDSAHATTIFYCNGKYYYSDSNTPKVFELNLGILTPNNIVNSIKSIFDKLLKLNLSMYSKVLIMGINEVMYVKYIPKITTRKIKKLDEKIYREQGISKYTLNITNYRNLLLNNIKFIQGKIYSAPYTYTTFTKFNNEAYNIPSYHRFVGKLIEINKLGLLTMDFLGYLDQEILGRKIYLTGYLHKSKLGQFINNLKNIQHIKYIYTDNNGQIDTNITEWENDRIYCIEGEMVGSEFICQGSLKKDQQRETSFQKYRVINNILNDCVYISIVLDNYCDNINKLYCSVENFYDKIIQSLQANSTNSFGKKKVTRILSLNQIKKYIKYLQRL